LYFYPENLLNTLLGSSRVCIDSSDFANKELCHLPRKKKKGSSSSFSNMDAFSSLALLFWGFFNDEWESLSYFTQLFLRYWGLNSGPTS
jgi:hypothetical protein